MKSIIVEEKPTLLSFKDKLLNTFKNFYSFEPEYTGPFCVKKRASNDPIYGNKVILLGSWIPQNS